MGFPGSPAGKESACNAGDHDSIPGSGRSPGEGIATHSSFWTSLVAQMVKNSPAMWETWVGSLGWKDPLEEGMATHSSILHGYFSKAHPLLLTLDEAYLFTAALPDLQCGMAPLGPPAPTQPLFFGCGVAPPGHCPWPWALPLTSDAGWLLLAVPVPLQPGTLGRCP